jgi:Holliday junction resolvase RusA-like endonuclease
MKAPLLAEKLDSISKKELRSLIRSEIILTILLHYNTSRYKRQGYDNTYIGDLDNIVSGIIDFLKDKIIFDDSQIIEIHAKRCVDDTLQNGCYRIIIGENSEKLGSQLPPG